MSADILSMNCFWLESTDFIKVSIWVISLRITTISLLRSSDHFRLFRMATLRSSEKSDESTFDRFVNEPHQVGERDTLCISAMVWCCLTSYLCSLMSKVG